MFINLNCRILNILFFYIFPFYVYFFSSIFLWFFLIFSFIIIYFSLFFINFSFIFFYFSLIFLYFSFIIIYFSLIFFYIKKKMHDKCVNFCSDSPGQDWPGEKILNLYCKCVIFCFVFLFFGSSSISLEVI